MITDPSPGLLVACAVSPDAELPRLVYADWLDDRGCASQAEYVRLCCAIGDGLGHPAAVLERASELAEGVTLYWEDQLHPYGVSSVSFDRGLPVGVTLGLDRFLAGFEAVRAAVPTITRVRLDREAPLRLADPNLDTLLEHPCVASLTRLAAVGHAVDDAGAERLAASTGLAGLTHLDVSWNRFGRAGMRALGESRTLRPDVRITTNGVPRTLSELRELAGRPDRGR